MADASTLVSQRALVPARNVDRDEIRVVTILVVVSAGDNDDDGFGIGRDLRIRNSDESPKVIELHAPWLLSQSCRKKTDQD